MCASRLCIKDNKGHDLGEPNERPARVFGSYLNDASDKFAQFSSSNSYLPCSYQRCLEGADR